MYMEYEEMVNPHDRWRLKTWVLKGHWAQIVPSRIERLIGRMRRELYSR